MQVSILSKTIPSGTRLEGSKKPDIHCVQNPPFGTELGVKSSTPGHKVRKFYKYIRTLFDMKSFVVSTNKTVFQ